MVNSYGKYIDFNMKTIDGWLPIELALKVPNIKAINIFIDHRKTINIDMNFMSQRGPIVFSLIDTCSLDLI